VDLDAGNETALAYIVQSGLMLMRHGQIRSASRIIAEVYEQHRDFVSYVTEKVVQENKPVHSFTSSEAELRQSDQTASLVEANQDKVADQSPSESRSWSVNTANVTAESGVNFNNTSASVNASDHLQSALQTAWVSNDELASYLVQILIQEKNFSRGLHIMERMFNQTLTEGRLSALSEIYSQLGMSAQLETLVEDASKLQLVTELKLGKLTH
jgi:lipopolysaccharide biosynthesis regulator YciM